METVVSFCIKNPHLSFASKEPNNSYVVHEEIVSTEKAEEPMP